MSKQINLTSYNLFQAKIVQFNEWKQSFLDKLVLYSFLLFHEQKVLEFLNFLTDQGLVSYKPISSKKYV